MAHVKWLTRIELVDEPFAGFQHSVAYRFRQHAGDPGEPVTRIAPRALMVPPGFPDFMSRRRVVRPEEVRLEGRAWSGRSPVDRVEVSTDAGLTWKAAELDPAAGHRWAWRQWHSTWTAEPGTHVLMVRAVAVDGETQPTEQEWNRGGFGNNAAQRVEVTCLG